MEIKDTQLYVMIAVVPILFLAFAFMTNSPSEVINGFLRIQYSASRLLTDFSVVGDPGGALMNAAIMGFAAIFVIMMCKVGLSGPTVAAVFTIMGFSLFGKTLPNTIPIVLGVFLASKWARKPFRNYLLFALFGTALGPLIGFVVLESGLIGFISIIAGLVAGLIAGFLLPGIGMAMLRFHEGYNLYNMGLATGFLGLFAASLLTAGNLTMSPILLWNTDVNSFFVWLIPVVSFCMIVFAVCCDRKELLKDYLRLLKQTGRLPSDFMDTISVGSAFLNMGIMGLLGFGYLMLIKADFNGPTLGALMTVIGFAAFGKHPKNTVPVAIGVFLATVFFGKEVSAPVPVLALLFGTTLAPLSGEFGPLIGIAAGFVHLTLVDKTAVWHGGIGLYNNGFAGGLTATVFVAVIEWIKSNRRKKTTKGRYK